MSSIATLGPSGTDAEAMARKLTRDVVLLPTFKEAMSYAKAHRVLALIACGYKQIIRGQVVDSWVDLHFREYGQMHIIDIYCEPTKTMCVARRKNCAKPKNIVIHPATQAFVPFTLWPELSISYIDAKPKAAQYVANGTYDSCIASKNIVELYDNLEIIEEFNPEMVWALYESTS